VFDNGILDDGTCDDDFDDDGTYDCEDDEKTTNGNGDDILDDGEDTNGNGILDDGICAGDPCEDVEDLNNNGEWDTVSEDCESEDDDIICNWNYFEWKMIGNDCPDQYGNNSCGGTDYTCFECGDVPSITVFNASYTCTELLAWADGDCATVLAGSTIEEICPESCGLVCAPDHFGNDCIVENIDVCGLCYGVGVEGNNCDCSGNEGNCAGVYVVVMITL
jgi:hypothetical protein